MSSEKLPLHDHEDPVLTTKKKIYTFGNILEV